MANDFKGLYGRFAKALTKEAIELQTKMLKDYAPIALQDAYNNRDFRNDTYNLKDSYAWVVYYNGVRKGKGFLGNKEADGFSNFHGQAINGRQLANDFISKYISIVDNGWELMMVAAAPYSVALEGEGFMVLSAAFDSVNRDLLGKAKVDFISHYY
mgnify:CR=1 FL=1